MEKIIIEQNGEVVEESQQIVKYTDYARVNFDDPSTIMRYGTDLITEIGNFQKDIANMRVHDSAGINTALEKIGKVFSFNEDLEEVDKNQELVPANPVKSLFSFVGSVGKKILGKDDSKDAQTYGEQFDNLVKDVEIAASALETEKNNTLINVGIDSQFINTMTEYTRKLKELIEIGEKDLDTYKLKITALEQECTIDSDQEKLYVVNAGKQKIQFFERRLSKLREQLAMYRIRIEEETQKQSGNMQLVVEYDEYITNTVPMVLSQASAMIDVKIQKQNIAKFNECLEVTNAAFQKNADMLVGNIQGITDLSKQGNIKRETLEKLDNCLQQGHKLLKSAKAEIEAERAKKDQIVDRVLTTIDERSKEGLGIWNSEFDGIPSSFETHNYPDFSAINKPKQKRFKLLPNIGKKEN